MQDNEVVRYNWPRHLEEFERETTNLVRTVLQQDFNPTKFSELLQLILEVPKRPNKFSAVKKAIFGRRNSNKETINDIFDVITSNNQLVEMISFFVAGRNKVVEMFVGTKYENKDLVICATYTQQLAQLFYQALGRQDLNESIIKTSILLHSIANFRNWLEHKGMENPLEGMLNGSKAEAGIARFFYRNNGVVIFPDYNNKEEIERWDVKLGTDLVCIINDCILLINSKSKKSLQEDSAAIGINNQYKNVTAEEQYKNIAKEALRTALESSEERKKLKHTNIKDYTIVYLVVTVSTHPSLINHLGGLHGKVINKIKKDLTKLGIMY